MGPCVPLEPGENGEPFPLEFDRRSCEVTDGTLVGGWAYLCRPDATGPSEYFADPLQESNTKGRLPSARRKVGLKQ